MKDLFEQYRYLFNRLTVGQALELSRLDEEEDYFAMKWFLEYLSKLPRKIVVTDCSEITKIEVRVA